MISGRAQRGHCRSARIAVLARRVAGHPHRIARRLRTCAPHLPRIAQLFDSHRLGEIARLVDVGSPDERRMVRKKLQRQREDERCH
jgi:hypothetical protein